MTLASGLEEGHTAETKRSKPKRQARKIPIRWDTDKDCAEKTKAKTWNSSNSRRHCKRRAQLAGGALLLPTLQVTAPFLSSQKDDEFPKGHVWHLALLQDHRLSMCVGPTAKHGIVGWAFLQILPGGILPCKCVSRHYLITIVSKSPVFSLLKRVCLYLRE